MRTVTDVSGEWSRTDDRDPRGIRVVETPIQGAIDVRIPVEDPIILGRDPGPKGLALADPRVSGVHLTIYPAEGGLLQFNDMGSKNGTFLNGRRESAGKLAEGDVLRIGSTILVVTRRGPAIDFEDPAEQLVGQSPRFRESGTRARSCARSQAPVLIRGETGAGKEGLARYIHRQSGRRGPFVAVNCATISGELANAALFGHEKGAYTGAVGSRRGFFREADGGTLFLDEIGDMPLEVQPRLLRALEQYEIVPVGASRPARVNVRIIAATHVDLQTQVAAKRFRGDLFARLNALPIEVAPLRQRREDILRLARCFAGRPPAKVPYGKSLFEPDLAEIMVLYDWPYNVRELRQVVEWLMVDATPPFSFDRLPRNIVRSATGREASPLPTAEIEDLGATQVGGEPAFVRPRRRSRPTRDELERALRAHGNNVSAVARAFDRDRKQVYRWLEHYGITLVGPDA